MFYITCVAEITPEKTKNRAEEEKNVQISFTIAHRKVIDFISLINLYKTTLIIHPSEATGPE